MIDEVDGALPGAGPYGGQDHLPKQEVWREVRQLRLGGRVLQLQGVGRSGEQPDFTYLIRG